MTAHAENPADLGHCRHCRKPPFLHDPWPARNHHAELVTAR
jgi:hypothetical protein